MPTSSATWRLPVWTSREILKTLLVRAGALGDLLLLRTATAALHARGDEVVLLAPAGPATVLEEQGPSGVDAIIDFEGAEVAPLLSGYQVPRSSLTERLASCGRARIYSLNPDLRRSLASLIPDVEVFDPIPPPGAGHAASWYARGLSPDPGPPPPLVPTLAEVASVLPLVSSLPQRFLAIHPGSGSPRKNWPFFPALASALSEGHPFLVVQGPADRDACAALMDLPGARVVQGLSHRQLGAVLAQAGLLVGNDSGVSHLGAAFGGRVLTLFGPTDPAVWSPLGRTVSTLAAPGGEMGALSMDAVIDAARGFGG